MDYYQRRKTITEISGAIKKASIVSPALNHCYDTSRMGEEVKPPEHDIDEEAALCLYLNEKKEMCVPFMHILAAMRKAATNLKKGGSGKENSKGLWCTVGCRYHPILSRSHHRNTMWMYRSSRLEPHVFRALAHYSKRGRSTSRLPLLMNRHGTRGTVRQVLEEAGKYQGIGDFRPLYGTFEVESMKVNGKEVK